MKIIDADELDFEADLVMLLDDHPFTGTAQSINPDGSVCHQSYQDGLLQGETTDCDENGTIRSRFPYHKNLLHGFSETYDPKGRIQECSLHLAGLLCQRWNITQEGEWINDYIIPHEYKMLNDVAALIKEKQFPAIEIPSHIHPPEDFISLILLVTKREGEG